jgi:hypothetical protein
MGVTASIVTAAVAVAGTGYSISKQEQAGRDAKTAAANALATAPNAAADQAKAQKAALDAQARAKAQAGGASGRQGTILTGPSGVNAAPPGTKTLLGL